MRKVLLVTGLFILGLYSFVHATYITNPYIDPSIIMASSTISATFVAKAGDTMTGQLVGTRIVEDTATFKVVEFDTSTTPGTHLEGRMYWDSTDHTLAIQSGLNDTTLQVGQENWIRARNNTGSIIGNGSIVYVTGRLGNRPTIGLAIATSSVTAKVLGMVTEDIGVNEDGFVTTQGLVRGINTNAYSANTTLYLSSSTAGAFSNVCPQLPNYCQKIGYVATNAVNGSVDVEIGIEATNHVVINTLGVLSDVTALSNVNVSYGVSAATGVFTGNLFSNKLGVGYLPTITGINSVAIGSGCVASGENSFAAGYTSEASRFSAVAMGYHAIATGDYSSAIGDEVTASGEDSFAVGRYTQSNGIGSTAMGDHTQANGDGSLACGYSSESFGNYSFAAGTYSKSYGATSFAMGDTCVSSASATIALGYKAVAKGVQSVSIGSESLALGISAVALGKGTTAQGDFSTSLGYNTLALGNYSTAMGLSTIASGYNATAFGRETSASENGSLACGYQSISSGLGSAAFGYGSESSGSYSFATGDHATAAAYASLALGRFNVGNFTNHGVWTDTDPIFEIGIGADVSNKANAMTVLKNGNVGIGTPTPIQSLEVTAGNIKTSYGVNAATAIIGGISIPGVYTAAQDPTGFVDRTAALTLSSTTATFSIVGTHAYYVNGVYYTATSTSIVISTTSGSHFVYYDTDSILKQSTSFPGFYYPLVANIYWSTNTANGIVSDERHGFQMDWKTHEYGHDTFGCRYESGFTGIFTNTTLSVTGGELHDEDLVISTTTTQTLATILYRGGSSEFKFDSNSSTPYKAIAGVLQYNNGTALTPVSNNYHTSVWVFGTNDVINPIAIVIGQTQNLQIADERLVSPSSLSLTGLPSPEYKLLYQVIYKNQGGTATYIESKDYRTTSLTGTNYTATSHALLTNLGYSASGHVTSGADGFAGTGVANTFSESQVMTYGVSAATGTFTSLGGFSVSATSGVYVGGVLEFNSAINRTGSTISTYTAVNIGYTSSITAPYGAIFGGTSNTVSSSGGTVVGGVSGVASGSQLATVVGGLSNTAGGYGSVSIGGVSNKANGIDSVIIGGNSNLVTGNWSTASGQFMKVTGNNSHAWGVATSTQDITAANVAVFFPYETAGSLGVNVISPRCSIDISGTQACVIASTQTLSVGTALSLTGKRIRVAGNGGAVTITANPPITAGVDGQVIIIHGTSDTNTVTYTSANGLQLNGGVSFTLGLRDVLALVYDNGAWIEEYRSNN